MQSIKGQLTLRGAVIGAVGCIVITAASVYAALKMGALPWPIVFAAIISLFFLKALGKGRANLSEANVTHTIMSAGAMVAGGLAFTIPGAWMLGYADQISLPDMMIVALSGVILGLIGTAFLRKHFIEDAELEYPIGEAAAQTLIAGNSGGRTGAKLFGALGISGIYTALRDWLGIIPAMLFGGVSVPGVAFGIYNSPMLLAVGFLVGSAAVVAWFAGAVFSNFGLIWGASSLGFWDISTGQGIVSSLGMGVMMGAGVGVICKDIVPKAGRLVCAAKLGAARSSESQGTPKDNEDAPQRARRRMSAGVCALGVAAVALALCFGLGIGPVPCAVVVILAFATCVMSAQSVGQTGIDPMEIFGLIVLLAVSAFSNIAQVKLFFVAGVIAVACGLAGDVMNDFRAGYVIGTSPRAQWIGQAIGSIVGAVVSVAVMAVLLSAYGPESFGPNAEFVSAQASVVATMVSGIPSVPSFAIGLAAGIALYFLGLPAMMLGLGIYLPFYMSLTAFIGALVKIVLNAVQKHRQARLAISEDEKKQMAAQTETGLVISSGLLGGESVVGVLIALAAVCSGSFA